MLNIIFFVIGIALTFFSKKYGDFFRILLFHLFQKFETKKNPKNPKYKNIFHFLVSL